MDINDIKHLATHRIYLIPDAGEGEMQYLWCDDPAPGMGMNPSEAVEYVRKDVHDKLCEERDALAAHTARLTLLLSQISSASEGGYNLSGDEIDEIEALIESAPATSLARRDLIKQAEALEEYSSNMPGGQSSQWRRMKDASAELRQQAKALK